MIFKPEDEARFLEKLVKDVECVLAECGVHGDVPVRPEPWGSAALLVRANDPIEIPPATPKRLPESAVELCRRLMEFADRVVEEHRKASSRASEVLPAGLAWSSESSAKLDVINDAGLGCQRATIRIMIAVSARESRLKRERKASERVQTSRRGGPNINDLVGRDWG